MSCLVEPVNADSNLETSQTDSTVAEKVATCGNVPRFIAGEVSKVARDG